MLKCNYSYACKTYQITFLFVLLCFASNILGQIKQTEANDYQTLIELKLENDFVFKTDVYFTQGLFLQVFSPFVNNNPLNVLLLPFGQNAKVYHGISLIQNLYTPIVKSDSIITTDRPFSAYLLMQSTRIALYKNERQRVASTFKIGVIGPPALGEEMQNGIHSLLPTSSRISGWQNQIKFDALLNYSAQYEKGILHNSFFDTDFVLYGNIGVPYTNFGSGFNFRIGKFSNYFGNFELSKLNKLQYFLSSSLSTKYVAYDATLQGGLFNRTSVNTIAASEINRFVGSAEIFGNLSFNNFKMKLGVIFTTQEFKTGLSHKWGVLSVIFGF